MQFQDAGAASRTYIRSSVLLSLGLSIAVLTAPAQTPSTQSPSDQSLPATQTSPPTIDYQRQVHPILAEKCLGCHSQQKRSGGPGAGDLRGRSGRRAQRRRGRPGNSKESLIMLRLSGATEPRMPFGGGPLAEADLATIRTWIDEGARPTPTAPPAEPKWEAPLSLERPEVPEPGLERLEPASRSLRGCLPERAGSRRAQARIGRAVCETRLPRYLGAAAGPGRVTGVPEGSGSRQARESSSRGCWRTTISMPRTGSRSGTICCATTRASTTTRKRRPAKASPNGCCILWNQTCPTTSLLPSCSIRPRPTIPRASWSG